jgi:ATP-binding cassette subfamily B protein
MNALEFPVFRQSGKYDCGRTCVKMIANHYGIGLFDIQLQDFSAIMREEVSMNSIRTLFNQLGLKSLSIKIKYEILLEALRFGPIILHWRRNHYVVLISITNFVACLADPAEGLVYFPIQIFQRLWKGTNEEGVCMLVFP